MLSAGSVYFTLKMYWFVNIKDYLTPSSQTGWKWTLESMAIIRTWLTNTPLLLFIPYVKLFSVFENRLITYKGIIKQKHKDNRGKFVLFIITDNVL